MMKTLAWMWAAVLAASLVAGSTPAQDEEEGFVGGGVPPDALQPERRNRRDPGARMLRFMARRLELTDEQVEEVRPILAETAEAARENARTLGEKHRALHALARGEAPDTEALRAVGRQIGELAVEQALLHAKTQKQLAAVLSEEQLARYVDFQARIRMMQMGPRRPGRAPGGARETRRRGGPAAGPGGAAAE
jgi:Spy/CpxP family protein refolding chaperone